MYYVQPGSSMISTIQSTEDQSPLWAVAWSPNGLFLAAAGGDRVIRIYAYHHNTTQLQLVTKLSNAHVKTIKSLHWHSRLLSAASFDGTVSVWSHEKDSLDNPMFKCIATLEGHENEVKSVRFSPDGRRMATCGRDKTVWIWNVYREEEDSDYDDADVEFECEAVLQEHSQDVKCLLWHPSSDILFSAGYDDTIKVFGCPLDGDEWLLLGTLTGHASTVWSLCWHDKTLVSVGEDRNVILWRDMNESSCLFNIDMQITGKYDCLHEEAIYACASFNNCIITGGADCLLRKTSSEGKVINTLQMTHQINAIAAYKDSILAVALDSGEIVLLNEI